MIEFNDVRFIENTVKELVTKPEDVKIDRQVDEMGVLLTLTVAPEDTGIVVGREGQTAKSLRCLLRIIGAKNKSRVNLRITDPRRSAININDV